MSDPKIVTTAIMLKDIDGAPSASALTGVPERTIYYWVDKFRAMLPSELEAYVAEQQQTAAGLYAHSQVANLEFADALRAAGDARGVQSATVAAGICGTKLAERAGQLTERGRFGAARMIEGTVNAPQGAPRSLVERLLAAREPSPAPDATPEPPAPTPDDHPL